MECPSGHGEMARGKGFWVCLECNFSQPRQAESVGDGGVCPGGLGSVIEALPHVLAVPLYEYARAAGAYLRLHRLSNVAEILTRFCATVLLAEIRRVLELGLDRGGTTLRDYRSMAGEGSNQFHLACYGRAGEECFRCGGELRGRVIDARSTTWCPVCQT